MKQMTDKDLQHSPGNSPVDTTRGLRAGHDWATERSWFASLSSWHSHRVNQLHSRKGRLPSSEAIQWGIREQRERWLAFTENLLWPRHCSKCSKKVTLANLANAFYLNMRWVLSTRQLDSYDPHLTESSAQQCKIPVIVTTLEMRKSRFRESKSPGFHDWLT